MRILIKTRIEVDALPRGINRAVGKYEDELKSRLDGEELETIHIAFADLADRGMAYWLDAVGRLTIEFDLQTKTAQVLPANRLAATELKAEMAAAVDGVNTAKQVPAVVRDRLSGVREMLSEMLTSTSQAAPYLRKTDKNKMEVPTAPLSATLHVEEALAAAALQSAPADGELKALPQSLAEVSRLRDRVDTLEAENRMAWARIDVNVHALSAYAGLTPGYIWTPSSALPPPGNVTVVGIIAHARVRVKHEDGKIEEMRITDLVNAYQPSSWQKETDDENNKG